MKLFLETHDMYIYIYLGIDLKKPDLAEVRKRINDLDAKLIDVITQRSALVKLVGVSKRNSGTPVYAPDREKQVIKRAIARNNGPLKDVTIEAIFRELMSGSFMLQVPLRISFLGPKGTFSHMAAIRHFGSSVELVETNTIQGVTESVLRTHTDHGVIPFENSTGGSINEGLDALFTTQAMVVAEALVDISHNLLAICNHEDIKSIHSKPEVFLQCREWLRTHFPRAVLVSEASTTAACQKVFAAGTNSNMAAIGSTLAGSMFELNTLFTSIQDRSQNLTRFLVLGRTPAKRTGDDRTLIHFNLLDNQAGALSAVLDAFSKNEVNLLWMDKRPSRRRNWEYTFFIDCEGHLEDANVAKTLQEAKQSCADFRVVGSYPRARSVFLSSHL